MNEPHTFLSYAHDDREFVDSLVEHLKDAGINVWYDRSLTPGGQWSKELENRIRSARGMIVVLSPDSSDSEYVYREVQFAKNVAGLSTIIPLLRRDCDIPLILSGDQWVDARGKSADNSEVINALRMALTGDAVTDDDDAATSASPLSDPRKRLHVPRFHYGGVVPPEFFIDRERELSDAEALIRERHNFLLVGVRRSGKTSFCKKLVHQIMGRPANSVLAGILNLESCSSEITIETFLGHTILKHDRRDFAPGVQLQVSCSDQL